MTSAARSVLNALRNPTAENAEPMRLAESLRRNCFEIDKHPTLVRWARAWWRYDGVRYVEVDDEWLRRDIRNFLDVVQVETRDEDGGTKKQRVTAKTKLVNDVNHALESVMPMLGGGAPQWTHRREHDPEPERFVACANGLLDLESLELVQATPRLFSTTAIGAAWNPLAPEPVQWLSFLHSIWHSDPDSIEALQEIFGYLLTPDTSQQKLLAFIGPGRSGKGTIARTLKALLGDEAVVNPTLASLERPFGMAPLVGKTLAIIGDARLGGRNDQAQLVERLLSISGEDPISVDRKNRDPINVRLRTRVLLISNELPKLYDTSGALASRFLILQMTRSFLGQEDRELEHKLKPEMPGIFRWAVEGREKLRQRGNFTMPAASVKAQKVLRGIASPIRVFVEEFCEIGDGFQVEINVLFAAYVDWCKASERQPTSKQAFGGDIRTVVPNLEEAQPTRPDGKRPRVYVGVRLCSN